MKAESFVHRHYSADAGESPTGHALAILVGLVMLVVGVVLIAAVVFLPVGIVFALLGVLTLGGGVFGHIQSPLKFSDLLDSIISLAGAAIALTFTLAIAGFLLAFGVSVVVGLVGWLRHAF